MACGASDFLEVQPRGSGVIPRRPEGPGEDSELITVSGPRHPDVRLHLFPEKVFQLLREGGGKGGRRD